MSKANLKRDIEILNRALFGDREFDEFGRSYAMLRKDAEYEQRAFDMLSEDKQQIVLRANAIMQKYCDRAVEWEKQPLNVRKQDCFYEEYVAHSKLTRHAFLIGYWMSEEEKKIVDDAFRLLLAERKKIDPYYISSADVSGLH